MITSPFLLAAEVISIHALRVEGDLLLYLCSQNAEIISIHALRVEGDVVRTTVFGDKGISIHALRVEGD